MQKKNTKKPHCPICALPILPPNHLVRYHIRYTTKPLVILACSYCNFIEFCLRTGKSITDPLRTIHVRRYMLKFGIHI